MKIFIVLIYLLIISNLFSKKLILWNDSSDSFAGIEFTPNKEIKKKASNNLPLWVSFLESTGFNITLTTFNALVLKRENSYLSWDSVKNNFTHGFDWDADALSTNFFLHPFQGSIYYNTARSNGNSYELSLMMAFLGSLEWEFFMEVMPPSVNDLIITSVSGSMLGEVFYRISSLILDDSTSGLKRATIEFSSGLITPSRFFNRIVNGDVSRDSKYGLYKKKKYKLNVGIGSNTLNKDEFSDFFNKAPGMISTVDFKYGNPFESQNLKLFRYFDLEMLLYLVKPSDEKFLSVFNVDGIIKGYHYKTTNNHHFIISFNQYFDYYNTEIYKIGALKFGPSFLYHSPDSDLLGFEIKANITFIPMGGILSTYSEEHPVEILGKSKLYNTSWGGSMGTSLKLVTKYLNLKFDYLFWILKTFTIGVAGADGTEYSSILRPTFEINFTRRIHLSLQYLYYLNWGKYPDYPDTKRNISKLRAYISYDF